MSKTRVSFSVKNGVYCVLITKDGYTLSKAIDKVASGSVNTFDNLLYVFRIAIRQLRSDMNTNADIEEVIFECNNSTFQKWLDRGNCNVNYVLQFKEILRNLNELPIRYTMIVNKKPKSLCYAKVENVKSGIQKLGISEMNFDDYLDE